MRKTIAAVPAFLVAVAAMTAALATPAQAAQIDLFENANTSGGFDYRTTPDTTFANNTFNNGHALDNAISSVVNYGSSAILCTGYSYTLACTGFPNTTVVNLGSGLNNAFSSINF